MVIFKLKLTLMFDLDYVDDEWKNQRNMVEIIKHIEG